MKKINPIIWLIIIFITIYILVSSFKNIDVNKVKSPFEDSLPGSSISSSTEKLSELFGELLKSGTTTTSGTENVAGNSTSSNSTNSNLSDIVARIAKDSNKFNFDGILYNRNDLPVEFQKVNTPTGLIYVKVVEDIVSQQRGLSGVSKMDDDVGMLFKFEESSELQFWMKDMNFALDIVWMDENFKIVDISENVLPESYPNTVSPIAPAKNVLEINALTARKIGLQKGVTITF